MTPISLAFLLGVLIVCFGTRFLSVPVARQLILLGGSYFLYAHWAGKEFLLILILSSLLNYGWGSVLRRRPTAGLLWIGVGLNVLLLAFFKYLPPLLSDLPAVSAEFDFVRHIVMPLGISFWTFQGLSYLFDVYREEDLDPSLLEFCVYMAFWPTVVSGPVCRLPKMLPQFRHISTSVLDDIPIGLVRIIQGLFMKFVLAHLLASGLSPDGGVTAGFDGIAPQRSGLDVWALSIGFGFQLFFDFAGYSHMVIGAALLLGIRVEENFNRPYSSVTPSIFWTRWHMSLSSWIRDYVFLPLASAKRTSWWPYLSLVIAMTVFGFWHDAKLTFIAWGIYHGILLVGHRVGQQLKRRAGFAFPWPAGVLLSWAATFLLVSLGWIFFRANDFGQALDMMRAVLTPTSYSLQHLTLPHDYYILILVIAGGYFVCVGLEQLATLWTSRYQQRLKEIAQDFTLKGPVGSLAGLSAGVLALEGILVQRIWWWATPLFAVLLLVTCLSVFGQATNIAPFIYTLF